MRPQSRITYRIMTHSTLYLPGV